MTDVRYTVADLERMRSAIRCSYPLMTLHHAESRMKEVEAKLLTYVAIGTRPEELEAYALEINPPRRGVQTWQWTSDGVDYTAAGVEGYATGTLGLGKTAIAE